ncbi:unnamed protein product [Macrosiphum euphorbiae]|uniref:HAT C-terminal dimerisation domain-containing protein n=1 Tax=Macrosiphum euphorbiae TaxID=13131 RepID=A0AAV0VL40_9HEMI|nr:unnamed protein product [Macrosiphum euphorbiae]
METISVSTVKKRKLNYDEPSTSSSELKQKKTCRKYCPEYLQIGFTWNGDEENPRPQCVICGCILANESMRPNKLHRHIDTNHPEMKGKPLDFYKKKLESLKTSKNNIFNFTATNQKATYASYKICLRIAQTGKPHTIGESLILPAIKDAVGILFDQKCLKEVEKLSLSNNTVSRRIDDISEWVENKLIERVKLSRWFSLQLDESTDIQGLSQMIVFVRYIWMNESHEDFLCCEPIIRGTSDEIFNTLNTYITAKGIEWTKCVGLCTDGARALCGKNSSVITKIREINPNVPWMHCNIHREALVSKSLSDDFRSVLNTSVKIVNFIKARPLQSRLFEKLCEEMGSIHKSLLLHTEVRWLSRGKVLTRLVELREEVTYYLDEKNDYVKFLRDVKFILKLTYLADIFSKLNELNLYLQGIGGDIFSVHDKIRAFMKKLLLWKNNIENKIFDCFESFSNFIIENQIEVDDSIITSISDHLQTLKDNFDSYFLSEMENYQQMKWISNPFQEHDMTSGLSIRAKEELIELFEDSVFKMNFNRKKLISFWLSVQENYPTVSNEAVKMLLPFISSYNCEVGFSAMVAIKTKLRSKLKLSNSLRLKLTNAEVDIDDVMKKNRKQLHPSH